MENFLYGFLTAAAVLSAVSVVVGSILLGVVFHWVFFILAALLVCTITGFIVTL